MGLTGLKARWWQGFPPPLSASSREKSIPCLLQFLGAPHIPWLMVLSSNFKARIGLGFFPTSYHSAMDFSASLFHTEELSWLQGALPDNPNEGPCMEVMWLASLIQSIILILITE